MPEIPWTYVSRLMSAAANAAEEHGVTVAIAVSDRDGALLGSLRMPGVPPLLGRLAEAKAYSAASLRHDTHDLRGIEETDPPLAAAVRGVADGAVVTAGGGLLIRDGERIVAAIGVSGGSGTQDAEIARAAMSAHPVGAWVGRG